MKKTVEIKKLGINGEGIAYINKKVCFVKGAIVGETVEVETEPVKNKNYYMGQLLKIIKPSPARIKSSCYQDKECQGCQLLHIAYDQQLEHKKALIKESLNKYSGVDLSYVQFHDVIGLNQRDHFLMEVNLPIVEFKDRVTFGIYQRESKYLTIMTGCMKHHALINQTLLTLEEIFNEHHCKVYHDKFKKGLRFIKIKVIHDQVHIVLITGQDGLKDEVIQDIRKLSYVGSLFMSINTSKYQDFENQGYKKIFGQMKNEYIYQDQRYLFSIKSHLPHNQEADEIINKIVKNMVKASHRIISLHSGPAILEMNLNQDVVAFDEKREHVDDAIYNAKSLHNDHIQFIYGPVEKKVVPYAKKKIYDTFIIHNEKNGLSNSIKDTLRLAKVETIIYFSISPSTMAKDIQDLSKYYHVSEIKAVDSHLYQSYVTTIVKLIRK